MRLESPQPIRTTLAFALSLAACGGRSELAPEPDPADSAELGRADLSLVQRLDSDAMADGDARGFARADQSVSLIYGRGSSGSSGERRRGACEGDPRVLLGLVSLDACIGAELFFRESFGGNGRTCGSCHPATNNFTLDPAFIAQLHDDDPLFVAEHGGALAELEQPELLRDFGLILVNADGAADPSAFVMRSVSHTLSMSTSITSPPPPDPLPEGSSPAIERTGWSGDGAPREGRLRDFPIGAVMQHATKDLGRTEYVDFLLPTETQLDQLESFQRGLGRKNEIELTDVRMSDPRADFGRRAFLFGPARVCEDCHRNGGANSVLVPGLPGLVNGNADVGTEVGRLAILDELGMAYDGGSGSAPFDTDRDGTFDSFGDGRFNSQPLIEAADTGPFFHTNSAESIEDAVRFYTLPAFGDSPVGQAHSDVRAPGPFIFTEAEIANLGRFFRVLNAAFNAQQALARLSAAFQVTEAFDNRYISIQRGLLRMAADELGDARRVLEEVDALNVEAQDHIVTALRDIDAAKTSLYHGRRAEKTRAALLEIAAANSSLGTGMRYVIGDSTLLF